MIAHKRAVALGLVAAGVLAVGHLLPAAAVAPVPPEAAVGPRIPAPVAYKDLMLVLVTRDGAAAVVFGDVIDDGRGVAYQFRYQSRDGHTTKAGEGQVEEVRLDAGGYDPKLLNITAGPIAVEWSRGGKDRGWIYYSPEGVQVHLAHANDFEDRVAPPLGDSASHKAIDLKRFMRK
jgi:hypothetical protein